jgi:hypothetical protein
VRTRPWSSWKLNTPRADAGCPCAAPAIQGSGRTGGVCCECAPPARATRPHVHLSRPPPLTAWRRSLTPSNAPLKLLTKSSTTEPAHAPFFGRTAPTGFGAGGSAVSRKSSWRCAGPSAPSRPCLLALGAGCPGGGELTPSIGQARRTRLSVRTLRTHARARHSAGTPAPGAPRCFCCFSGYASLLHVHFANFLGS